MLQNKFSENTKNTKIHSSRWIFSFAQKENDPSAAGLGRWLVVVLSAASPSLKAPKVETQGSKCRKNKKQQSSC